MKTEPRSTTATNVTLGPGVHLNLRFLCVTFGLNVRLNLSGKATTKSLCSLGTKLLLKILSEDTRTVTVRVIRGDEGVGAFPGVRGGSGGVFRNSAPSSSIDTRTQT